MILETFAKNTEGRLNLFIIEYAISMVKEDIDLLEKFGINKEKFFNQLMKLCLNQGKSFELEIISKCLF